MLSEKYFFSKRHAENEAGRIVPDHFLFFKKALHKFKASGQHLIYFDRLSLGHIIKTNCTIFEAIHPEIGSILIFYKSVRDQLPHHILYMIFQGKYYSCCILLTGQISLSSCFYFLGALLEVLVRLD